MRFLFSVCLPVVRLGPSKVGSVHFPFMSVVERARGACAALQLFLTAALEEGGFPGSVSAAQKAKDCLEADFDLGCTSQKHKRIEVRKLQRKASYLRGRVCCLKKQLLAEKKSKLGGRLEKTWLIRAGLSDPNVSVRKMEEFLQSCSVEQSQTVSHSTVSAARDCFAELVKQQARSELSGEVASQKPRVVFVSHIHDEALMRLRSHVEGLPNRGAQGEIFKDSK